jgi:hypothetical protein
MVDKRGAAGKRRSGRQRIQAIAAGSPVSLNLVSLPRREA